jgi:hypothetical protein
MNIHAQKPREPIPAHPTPVKGLTAIEFLVKESEILTGQPGRVFVISGADQLAYRVRWHPLIIEVERLDGAGAVVCTQHLPPDDFATHSIVEALAAGQLYTVPVSARH